jgi:hypothetical protein
MGLASEEPYQANPNSDVDMAAQSASELVSPPQAGLVAESSFEIIDTAMASTIESTV